MTKFASMLCGLGLVLAFQATAPAQTITNQPQSITINNASTATFTVGASNATSYQWQFNGSNLTDVGNITGSTNSALTLEDVTSNQMGNYSVIVSNSTTTNSVTSSNAVLTIVPGTIVTFTFSGFIGGGASNVEVQLFDHDKPATVENFIHYIRSGAFTNNMFFERCIPGFILQGGDYGASNQTMTTSPLTGWDILTNYALATNQTPPFPPQVDSEFNVGPLIKNDFGTLAMALESSLFSGTLSNTARNGFFFNLADNSGSPYYLDSTSNGPFSVFGRVISGTNVLGYFNTLTNGSGIVTNEVFLDNGSLNTNPFPNLPVNYVGNAAPANSNLVFCDIPLPTNAPVYTNRPTVSITSPAAPVPVTNLQGTASDNVGLAVVICVLTPQATDGIYPYPYTNAAPVTNYAVGTTNWSLSLSPGGYDVSVESQNGAGYLSAPATNPLTVTTIVTNGNGTVTFTNSASNIVGAVGYPFQDNTTYNVLATPGTNQLFISWTASEGTNVNPEVTFTMFEGFVLTATFISNGIPNGIAFTYPAANAVLSSGTFNITGTIATNASPPVTVTGTICSQSSGFSVSPAMTTIGTTNWSIPVTNLPSDLYTVEVTATDSETNTTAISENFSVGTPLQVIILGDGTVSAVTNGEYLPVGTNFQVTATPNNSGESFYAWSDGAEIFTNSTETFTMSSNLTLTAEFVSIGARKVISFTHPTAYARLNTNTFPLKVRLASSAKSAQVTCQIFSLTTMYSEPVPPLTLTNTGANTWSATVSNLPPDWYEVEAVATYDMDGKSTSSAASEKFYVLDFKQVEGTYTGLFICYSGPVAPTNSGFCAFTVTASGAFSGRLLFPAYPPLTINSGFSIFGYTGTYTWDIPGNRVDMYLSLDLTGETDELTGYVYSASNSWYSPILCHRAVTKLSDHSTPAPGKYILSLDPTNSPNTNGYASLSVGGGGTLALSGALPDGASFSQSARVATNGVWPLYVIPTGYKKSGMLMGWETNLASNSCSGQLYWYKAPNVGAYYTNGVDTNVNSTGTNYLAPEADSYSIVFQGGTMSVPVTNELTMTRIGGQFKPVNPTDKLAISLSANGVLTGHFVSNSDTKPLQFKGAFFGPSQGERGSGFILDGDGQTGYFLLEPHEAQ